ncbi:MAG TPA: radical SAM protein [Chitinophagales bacterium]|nr:radical SAM protein [Chitinophagales bacterium]
MEKILLTHAYFLEEDPKELLIMKPYVPLGILCISAFLEEHGFENEVYDSTFSSFEKLKQHLLSKQPGVIGIYTNLMTKLNVLRLIRFIKEEPALSNTKIVLGGPEVTHHAANFLKHGADVIVVGEGEQTMLELCEFYSGRRNSLDEIAGIAFHQFVGEKKELTVQEKSAGFKKNPANLREGGIIKTSPRANLRNLDELPFPNRKKVTLQLYFDVWKSRHGASAISVSTMRGCPYTCKWCSRAVYGESYRRRSAKKVADEIELLQQHYSFDTIWFVDDVFTISHKWMKEFDDELHRRKISIRYECITRADRMNEEVIRLLKNSGCFRVWIGAESGSQKVIDAMDRRVDVQQVREMIGLAKQNGIAAGTFIMLGYPGEADEDVKQTLQHLKISDPDYYTITIAYPIKGTPMYDEVESQFISQLEWSASTDRQIDFKRKYSRRYYDFAVHWIYNEMAIQKVNGSSKKFFEHKIKALALRGLMKWEMMMS